MDEMEAHQQEGGKGLHLQAIPLRGCEIASIWIECQQPGASSPQTASAPCPHPCDSPHQLLLQASSLAVCHLCPAESQAGAPPLWVIFPPEPLWSEPIYPAWPQGGLLQRGAAPEDQHTDSNVHRVYMEMLLSAHDQDKNIDHHV